MDGCTRGKSVLVCLQSGVGHTNRDLSTCLLTMLAGSARIYMAIAGTSPSIIEKHDIWENTRTEGFGNLDNSVCTPLLPWISQGAIVSTGLEREEH